MKIVSFVAILLSLSVSASGIESGEKAERTLLSLIESGSEIFLITGFPNSRDSDRYFRIGPCHFPSDPDLASEMLQNWTEHKIPGGLQMLVSAPRFLQWRKRIQIEAPNYLSEVFCSQ